MKRQFWGRALTLIAVSATLTIFVATELDARGRGGGRGGGGRGGFSRSGPAAGGSVGVHRQGGFRGAGPTRSAGRSDMRSNRADTRRDVRSNRTDARRDVRDNRREVRHDVRHEVHEHHEWHEDRWKRRLGAALTVTAFSALTCQRTTVVVNGVSYTSCDGNWYSRAYGGGQTTYVIVNAPPGY